MIFLARVEPAERVLVVASMQRGCPRRVSRVTRLRLIVVVIEMLDSCNSIRARLIAKA